MQGVEPRPSMQSLALYQLSYIRNFDLFFRIIDVIFCNDTYNNKEYINNACLWIRLSPIIL